MCARRRGWFPVRAWHMQHKQARGYALHHRPGRPHATLSDGIAARVPRREGHHPGIPGASIAWHNRRMNDIVANLTAQPILGVGTVLFVIGLGFAVLFGLSFRIRAVLNKRAWNGPTRPFFFLMLLTLIPGIALIGLQLWLNQGH